VLQAWSLDVIDAGSRHAHRELEARIRPFVARRVPPPDVDDVVQDVFLRLQKGLPGLRDEERVGPWVYGVARSAIAEHRRACARHPLASEEPPEVPTEAADVEEEGAAERSLALAVAPFISVLPSPYREALTLTELEGLTQREAAEMLGISLSGMKSRVQRGRVELRKMLDLCCEIRLDARGRVITCDPRPRTPEAHAAARAACGCDTRK
jgi:RNA polymerase sigma-70 factor (ECF subfamily)